LTKRRFQLKELLFLALAGSLGTLSRYGLSGLTQKLTGAGFPYGTLTVNVLGSLIIGFIMQVGLSTDIIPRTLRLAITLGFLGAFTTFSTFSYETVSYLEDGAWLLASMNILANLVLCIGATFLGMMIGRLTVGGA
jgi:CrcB protein